MNTQLALQLDALTKADGTAKGAPYGWDRMSTKENREEFLRQLNLRVPEIQEEGQLEDVAALAATPFDDLPIILWMYIRLGYDIERGDFQFARADLKITRYR